jgi:hypothetical protein
MSELNDPLEATIKKLLQERTELDSLIAALQKRLGKPIISAPTSIAGIPDAGGNAKPVYRGAFFNLSIPKAAEKALKGSGIPLKTPQIMEIFDQAGFEIKSKTPRASLYTALARSRDFVKVLPDTWDLSERHPEAAAQKEQELLAARTTKGNKKKRGRTKQKATEEATTEGLRTVA